MVHQSERASDEQSSEALLLFETYSERRARDSNPQPVSRHLISSQAANHSLTLPADSYQFIGPPGCGARQGIGQLAAARKTATRPPAHLLRSVPDTRPDRPPPSSRRTSVASRSAAARSCGTPLSAADLPVCASATAVTRPRVNSLAAFSPAGRYAVLSDPPSRIPPAGPSR